MHSDTARYIEKNRLIRQGERVLCMVSGGADSVAMLQVLNALSKGGHPAFPAYFALGICHVNYGRRGEASNEDEQFVRALADRLGTSAHIIQAPREQNANFQAWARDFRYLAAQNLCRWQGYTRVAVAHNKDDRIETFIYRLMTYSGRRSLVVMPARRGRIIRPLLFASSVDIRKFCEEQGFDYKVDASNDTLDYSRNQIRKMLIPPMEQIRPDFRDRIGDTISLLEDEEAVLDSITAEAWDTVTEVSGEDETVLKSDELSRLPRSIARLVIRRWLADFAIHISPSRRLLDALIDICQGSEGSARLSLPGGVEAERRYDRLLLRLAPGMLYGEAPGKEQGGPAPKDIPEQRAGEATGSQEEAILPVPGKSVFSGYEIEAVDSPSWNLRASGPMRVTMDARQLINLMKVDNIHEPQASADAAPPEIKLKIRSWRPGDKFSPLGLGGTKSIQDLFTDEKVPRSERGDVPVITCGGRIIWVCGLRISEDVKVTAASGRRIGLKAKRRAVARAI